MGAHRLKTSHAKGRWRLVLVLIVAVCGGALIIVGLGQGSGIQAAPLPTRDFNLPSSALGAITAGNVPSRLSPGQHVAVTDSIPGSCTYTLTGKPELVIPSVCLHADVVNMAMATPTSFSVPGDVRTVGVWDGGAPLTRKAPTGTTLIAGHVHLPGQGNGSLFTLHQVQPGALVYVVDANRNVTQWRVTLLQSILRSKLPQWLFDGTGGTRRIAIVTCGGDVTEQSGVRVYSDNVIAGAVPFQPKDAAATSSKDLASSSKALLKE